jgi:hypothetical protein
VLAAGLLQLFDFWDASHTAADEADNRGDSTRLGSLWHGITHRREPDPGNASYWFRRVGHDPAGVFGTLALRAGPVIEASHRPPWSARVVRAGLWDPFAFIEACGSAQRGSDDERLARKLQRLEMLVTLDASWATL